MVTLGSAVNFVNQIARQDEQLIGEILAIDPLRPNFEARALSNVTEWSEEKINTFLEKERDGEAMVVNVANGFGVPFGMLRYELN